MYARRQGRIFNLYSEPIADFDNPPDDFLIGTEKFESLEQFKQKYPTVPVAEKQVAEPPSASGERRMSPGQLIGIMAGLGMGADKIEKLMSQKAGVVQTAPLPAPEPQHFSTATDQAMLSEFKLLLARHYADTKNHSAKVNATAVANFILKVAPHLREQLEAAKQSFTEEEFKL